MITKVHFCKKCAQYTQHIVVQRDSQSAGEDVKTCNATIPPSAL